MTKADCKKAMPALCQKWAEASGISSTTAAQPSFYDDNYPNYLRFRTTTSVQHDVEMWFDHEFKQTWRN